MMLVWEERGKEENQMVVMRGRDDLNAWLTRSFPRFCCVSALPPALSLQGHRCCYSGDCTDCNEYTNRKVQGIVLDQKERMCASERERAREEKQECTNCKRNTNEGFKG